MCTRTVQGPTWKRHLREPLGTIPCTAHTCSSFFLSSGPVVCLVRNLAALARTTESRRVWQLGSVAKNKEKTPNQLPRGVYRVSRVARVGQTRALRQPGVSLVMATLAPSIRGHRGAEDPPRTAWLRGILRVVSEQHIALNTHGQRLYPHTSAAGKGPNTGQR